jgi:hypothetical protein
MGDKMRKRILMFLTCAILILIFLGLVSHPSSQKTKTEQQNGVTVISNPKTPQPGNGIPIRIVFTEELSIGAEYGDEEYMFGNRVYFNVDVDGKVYVNDWDKKSIRKFDPDGNYLLTIGGPGQGPGEFRNVWHPRFDKNNDMYVSDSGGNRRISIFKRDGTLLKLIRLPIRLSDISISYQGNYIGYLSTMIEDPKGDSATRVLGLFDSQFQLLKEFHKTTREFKPLSGKGEDSYAQFLADLIGDDAFKPSTTYVLADDDSIYFGYPANYEIKIFSPEGELKKIITKEYEPIKITKKHIESFVRFQEEEFFRYAPSPEDAKEKAFDLIEYPKFKPAYDTFVLMDNGWIAVVVDYVADEYTLIDLFDREGTYIAQFEAKIPRQNLLFKNGKAYALAIENDFRYVKRYGYEVQEHKNDEWIRKKLPKETLRSGK